MSFLDVGGGGGDAGGGGKGGGAGDGGGGGGSAANPLGDSPDLTGMGGPGGDMAFGGPPGFDMGMGGQQNITTPSPSDPSNDPNVGAPQSQNPTPGQSPTSIGGTQSGGGSPLEQLLKGVRAQASPLEAAAVQGQGYGGGQAGTSTGLQETIPPGTATELQQQQAGGAQRFAPGRPDLSTEPTFAQQPDVHQQQTAGQAQRFAPAGARPDTEAQQVAAGQAARYPSAGAQETDQQIAEARQAGTAGQAQRYPPEGAPPAAQPPRDPNVPPPEAPKTGDTSTAATTAAPPASTGPVSSRGQGPAAQGANPLKIIGDLLQGVLTGNFGPLSQDLQGLARQPGAQPGPGGYGPPSTGGQPPATAPATAPATPPAVGSQAMNSRPGAPDGPSPAANDAQGQRRQEWYQTHDRASPFPEDQFPEQQGPTKEGGVLPDYAGQPQTGAGGPAVGNPNQALVSPQATSSTRMIGTGNTQPTAGFSNTLREGRAPNARELNPQTRGALKTMMMSENGKDPIGPMEAMANRMNFFRDNTRGARSPRGTDRRTIMGELQSGFYGPYNRRGRTAEWRNAEAAWRNNPRLSAQLDQVIDTVFSGSNQLGGATDQGLPTDPNGGLRSGRVQRRTSEIYTDGPWNARGWRQQIQARVRQEGGAAAQAPQPTPPPPPRARTSGLDLLQGQDFSMTG